MNTKEFFRNYTKLQNELIQMEEGISNLRKIAVISLSDNNNVKVMVDGIINKYNAHIEHIIAERVMLEELISKLKDPIERTIMRYKYIDGYTWDDICQKISYEWSQTHRIHRRALKNIEPYLSAYIK